MMPRIYFTFLVLFFIHTLTHAQQGRLEYQQAGLPGLTVSSSKNLRMALPFAAVSADQPAQVVWKIEGKEIQVVAPVEQTEENADYGVAEFYMPLLDAAIEGHLDWGKAVLEALDSQQVDSIVAVQTHLTNSKDSMEVKGILEISFRGGAWKEQQEFWNRAAQYKLLAQQTWVNDSVFYYKKETRRAQALLDLTKKSLQQLQADQQTTRNTMPAHCQDSTAIDSLLQLELAISQAFDEVERGKALTNAVRMKIADQTTQRGKWMSQINPQKDEKCQQLLNTLLRQARFQHNTLRQQKALRQILQKQQNKLQDYQQLQRSTSEQLALMAARLPK